MLAYGLEIGAYLALASLLLTAYTLLSQKKPKVASLDDALQTTATQGAFIPLVIGRWRGGPVVAFVEDTSTFTLAAAQGGQTGLGKGNGGVPEPNNYTERALHLLAVGPGSEFQTIYQNGKVIWSGPISPASHPSGTGISCPDNEGNFSIYWGFRDDPVIPGMGASPNHGIATSYPLALKILWDSKNLGQSRQWPRLEYEFSCPCYSQIGLSASEVPLEGDDRGIPFEEMKIAYVPGGFLPTDRVELGVHSFRASDRSLAVVDLAAFQPSAPAHPPRFFEFIKPGDMVRIYSDDVNALPYPQPWPPTATHQYTDPTVSLLGLSGVWRYFFVAYVTRIPLPLTGAQEVLQTAGNTYITDFLRVQLGAEVPPSFISNQSSAPPKYPSGVGPSHTTAIARLQLVDTRNADGINPIHVIDQLLFAKYPHGAGRDRSKFDTKSIEEAALTVEQEKIRGYAAVRDGEGLESVLAPLMQDLGLMIAWDVEIGKHVFRLVRYQEATVDLPADAVLKVPTMEAITGNRTVDVIAFTFNDRERNYREVPLKVMDSGQVAEYESQRSQKVPIEVTLDRDSVARMLPRRQQEAFANQSAFAWETNHATKLAMAGSIFKATTVEGPEYQFRVSAVQRDLNSSKVVLKTLLDIYNPPPLTISESFSSNEVDAPGLPSSPSTTPQLQAAAAFELPMPLHDGSADTQLLVLASRKDGRSSGALVWGSRDGTAFEVVGYCPIVARGLLARALPGPTGPSVDLDNYPIEVPVGEIYGPVETLVTEEDSWRAGRQLLIVDGEVIFLRDTMIEDEEDGMQQGYIGGMIRGRAGTTQVAHSIGAEFWVLQLPNVKPLKSPLFVPGKSLTLKVQGLSVRGQALLAEVEETGPVAITGSGLRPPRPAGLRLSTMATSYPQGGGPIDLRWCYFSKEFPHTGLGFQPLGSTIATSAVIGHFLVEILNGATVLDSFTITDNFLALSLSERNALGLDALGSWTFRVSHVQGAYTSLPATLTLTPV